MMYVTDLYNKTVDWFVAEVYRQYNDDYWAFYNKLPLHGMHENCYALYEFHCDKIQECLHRPVDTMIYCLELSDCCTQLRITFENYIHIYDLVEGTIVESIPR